MHGEQANTDSARELDSLVKLCSDRVFQNLGNEYIFELRRERELLYLPPHAKMNCNPDGGIWYFRGVLIAAFEAKTQGPTGNAIERWFKNSSLLRRVNPDVSYVTFASGQGAADDGIMWKTLSVEHDGQPNIYRPGKNSCILRPQGFDEHTIYRIMERVLCERIKTLT